MFWIFYTKNGTEVKTLLKLFSTEGFIYPIVVTKVKCFNNLYEFRYYIDGILRYRTYSQLDNPHVSFDYDRMKGFDSNVSNYRVIEC